MTQGQGGQVPPPYPPQPIQPDATPRGSSTFVYNGRQLKPDRRVVDDEYEEEEVTSSMVEMLNLMEERDNYKSQVDAAQRALSRTEFALRASLAREEQLKSELDTSRAMISTFEGSTDPARYNSPRLHQTSPIANPTTPFQNRYNSPRLHLTSPIANPTTPFKNRSDRFSHVSPTPPSRCGNAYTSPSPANQVTRKLFPTAGASPSRGEGSSDSDGSASRAMDSLADFYNFLNRHGISHLRSTLDVIRHANPISNWALQLEEAGVPYDLIDSAMVLMIAANA